MVDFAGWAMPVQYTSIIDEHRAIRSAVGMADISHMGRLRFEGPGAAVFLAELLTRRVADMELGQIRYSLVTNDAGGILDDVLVGYYHNSHGQPFFLVVVNASNRAKIVDWVRAHLPQERPSGPATKSSGPTSAGFGPCSPSKGRDRSNCCSRWSTSTCSRCGTIAARRPPILHPAAQRQGGIISRTGYTGEDGFELSLGAEHRPGRLGSADGAGPAAGRRARRARRPRYAAARGRHAAVRPRVVRADRSVPGRPGLRLPSGRLRFPRPRRPAADPKTSRRNRSASGWRLSGKRAARQGCPILAGGQPVGEVTSGTYSPTLGKPIAMGYVAPEFAQPGTELQIDIRGRHEPARVVELPFYQSQRTKGTRQK